MVDLLPCAHPSIADFPEALQLIDRAEIREDLRSLAEAIASKGGGHGIAAIVLTDVHNVRWFYPPGQTLPDLEHLRAKVGDFGPVTIGRRLDELLPRVRAVCPYCALALRQTPRGYLPIYLRIGEAGAAFRWRWPFPGNLEAHAKAVRKAIARRGVA